MTEDLPNSSRGSSGRPEFLHAPPRPSAEIEPADDAQLLLASRRPSRRQISAVIALATFLLVAFLATLPYRATPLPRLGSLIPVTDTMLFLGDALTAVLLFGQAAVLRSRAFVALGSGYLFTALIIVPHALTFPGAFSSAGLLGAGLSTTIWLYAFWHIGLPLAVIAYAYLKVLDRARPLSLESVRPTIFVCISGCVLLAVALTLLATVGEPWLPAMAVDPINWLPGVSTAAWFLIALVAAAMVTVARGGRSVLDIWLLLALMALLLELVLVLTTSMRYSGGWYTGRVAGLLSGLFVLLMLLSETNKLYTHLVLSVLGRRRERASRLLTVNAVASSIAHELKQPLTSISTNAQTGSLLLSRTNPDHAALQEVLADIAQECGHASEVVDSMRAMFGNRLVDKTTVNINELLRETSRMISNELLAHQITLQLTLDEQLPQVPADRVQLQHVFLNLFVNAIEAMSAVTVRDRALTVQSSLADEHGVLIVVEDTGDGIDPAVEERIYDPFFSTKPNGTGMGLSSCRTIVELHGGRLWAAPRQPAGTRFNVWLPRRAVSQRDGL